MQAILSIDHHFFVVEKVYLSMISVTKKRFILLRRHTVLKLLELPFLHDKEAFIKIFSAYFICCTVYRI